MWYNLTKEYYSVIKRDKVLIHAMPWMKLQDIKQSERSQTHKETHTIFFFLFEMCRKSKFIDVK